MAKRCTEGVTKFYGFYPGILTCLWSDTCFSDRWSLLWSSKVTHQNSGWREIKERNFTKRSQDFIHFCQDVALPACSSSVAPLPGHCGCDCGNSPDNGQTISTLQLGAVYNPGLTTQLLSPWYYSKALAGPEAKPPSVGVYRITLSLKHTGKNIYIELVPL